MDCRALVAAFPYLLNYNVTESNCCISSDPNNVYQRVICDSNNRISQLDLSANGLQGPIPDFSSLTELTQLNMFTNELNGTIPTWMGSLSKLQNLGLYNNLLTGSIPTALAEISSLQQVDLSNNFLTGDIPPQFGKLPKLTDLVLYGNCFNDYAPGTFVNISDFDSTKRSTGCDAIQASVAFASSALSSGVAMPSSTASTANNANSSSSSQTMVIGIAVGVVVVVALAILGVCFLRRRRQRAEAMTNKAVFEIRPSEGPLFMPNNTAKSQSNAVVQPENTNAPVESNVRTDVKMGLFAHIAAETGSSTNFNASKNIDYGTSMKKGTYSALPSNFPNDSSSSHTHATVGFKRPSTVSSPTYVALPSDPYNWSVADVGTWLYSHNWHRLIAGFREKNVDGRVLLSLTPEELKLDFGMDNLQLRTEVKDAIGCLKTINATTTNALDGQGDAALAPPPGYSA